MIGDVLETAHLIGLFQQVEQRVEDDEDQPVVAVHRDVGEVTDGHGEVGATWLGPQLLDHRLGDVHPVDADPAGGQREGDPAGTDRQFERWAGTGEVGEKLDRLLLVASPADRVVAFRGLGSKAHHRLVVVHPTISLGWNTLCKRILLRGGRNDVTPTV